jgi:hypothetical protein
VNYWTMATPELVARIANLASVHEGFWNWVDWLDDQGGRQEFEARWSADAVEIFARRFMSASSAEQEATAIEQELQRRIWRLEGVEGGIG